MSNRTAGVGGLQNNWVGIQMEIFVIGSIESPASLLSIWGAISGPPLTTLVAFFMMGGVLN